MGFSKIEQTVILALYYFEKKKNIDSFTNRFNQYFKKDLSTATVLFELSRIKNVDPANNVQDARQDEYVTLWEYYIVNDRIQELRSFYKSFKHGDFIYKEDNLPDEDEKIPFTVRKSDFKMDEPEAPPANYEHGIKAYKRHREVVLNSLALAGYICEAECGTELFYRKDGKTYYTEAHHIIPLCYQKDFKYSLDTEANVVSLCPRCHRLLHYGMDYEDLLNKLYKKRVTRLEKCGTVITFEQLLLLYR